MKYVSKSQGLSQQQTVCWIIKKRENLESYLVVDKSTIKSGLSITIAKNVMVVESASNMRHVFDDLTNYDAYLELIKTLHSQNEKYDQHLF